MLAGLAGLAGTTLAPTTGSDPVSGLTVTGVVNAPRAATYRVSGSLTAPDGTNLSTVSRDIEVSGSAPVSAALGRQR